MNFKAGDRARHIWLNLEGTIVALCPQTFEGRAVWDVNLPGAGPGPQLGRIDVWACAEANLRPLTPPAEDAWASEQVRKVTKPQHVEPVVVKEKA